MLKISSFHKNNFNQHRYFIIKKIAYLSLCLRKVSLLISLSVLLQMHINVNGQNIINLSELTKENKGFYFEGIKSGDLSGWQVSGANDIDGDGNDDLLIGARFASPKNRPMAGQVFSLFGSLLQNLKLANLDQRGVGFTIDGKNATFNGYSVSSAGDVDGDGKSDIIMGARDGRPLDRAFSGEAYLLFGSNFLGDSEPIEASDIKSPQGVVFFGARDGDFLGNAVSDAGDFNGDGFDDFLLAALEARNTDNEIKAGRVYLIFGGPHLKRLNAIDLLNFDPNLGIEIIGNTFGDLAGYSIDGGNDINNDNFDDIIISAIGANKTLDSNLPKGECYIIFGGPDKASPIILSKSYFDGNNGFYIQGINESSNFGFSTALIGDINRDGIDDFAISEIGSAAVDGENAPPFGNGTGKVYVVFGQDVFSDSLSLNSINGINGFIIEGKNSGDFTGWSIDGKGDVNNDGIDDLIIGAPGANPNDVEDAGEIYIIYGNTNFNTPFKISKLYDDTGVIIIGEQAGAFAGWSVSLAGDVNNDGFDEVMIGSPFNDVNNQIDSGKSYLVFINKSEEDDSFSDIQNEDEQIKLSIFPNPSSEFVSIRLNLLNSETAEIGLYDILGRKVTTIMPNRNLGPGEFTEQIDLSNLSNGIYLVKINTRQEILIRKFLVLN